MAGGFMDYKDYTVFKPNELRKRFNNKISANNDIRLIYAALEAKLFLEKVMDYYYEFIKDNLIQRRNTINYSEERRTDFIMRYKHFIERKIQFYQVAGSIESNRLLQSLIIPDLEQISKVYISLSKYLTLPVDNDKRKTVSTLSWVNLKDLLNQTNELTRDIKFNEIKDCLPNDKNVIQTLNKFIHNEIKTDELENEIKLLNAESSLNNRQNDREASFKLKGIVKSVLEKTYSYNDENSEPKFTEQKKYIFNRNGNLIQVIANLPDGNEVENKYIFSQEEVDIIFEVEKDLIVIDANIIEKHDGNKNLIERYAEKNDSSGYVKDAYKYFYDDDGKLIEKHYVYQNESNINKKYEAFVLLHLDEMLHTENYSYEYSSDNNGNWIKRIEFIKTGDNIKKPVGLIERIIEYFE
jgi:hypothetical protein